MESFPGTYNDPFSLPFYRVFHFQLNQRKFLYKKPNSHRTGLEHQHGRRFNVLEHALLVANRKKNSKIRNFIFVKCFELNSTMPKFY